MVCIGVISYQMGGRAIWIVPTTFVVVMALGGTLGMIKIGLFSVELVVAISVLVLGLVIASSARVYISLIYVFVAIFAIFHGSGTGHPSISYFLVQCFWVYDWNSFS